jgi:AcrR family transcriptional regulator
MASRGGQMPTRPQPTGAGTRRVEILQAATKLFRDKGFAAVTVDEIGAAVGVTGPALYRHFASKEDILVSVLTTAGDRISADARRVSRVEKSPRRALRSIVQSYLVEVIPHRRLVGSYLQGTAFPADSTTAAPLRARQLEYLRYVSTVLRRARPELSSREAQTLVHATFGVLNSIAWSDIRIDKGAADLLESAAMATLFSGTSASQSATAATRRSRIRASA